MKAATKLIGAAALVTGSLLGYSATASAGPSHEVLCERVGGGRIPSDIAFVNWGCELTDATPAGKQRLLRVADKTNACPREDFMEFDFDFGPSAGGHRLFLICMAS